MTLDPTNGAYAPAADTYTNVSGLESLRRGAADKDPKAIRQVAQQFEAMFTGMMLKSMRDTVGKDPIFGSDQEDMLQGMYDQQLSLQLSKGKGLGLANMLIHQLQRLGVKNAGAAATATSATPAARPGNAGLAPPARNTSLVPSTSTSTPASAATKMNFISNLLPQARAAGAQLGVDPSNLIAQAALETHWGQNLPAGSNNLFGIKAGGHWSGATASAATTEYQDGEAVNTDASFRSYQNTRQSVQDYVALLRNDPRYASALDTGSNAKAFASGLKRGGYATDPDYVRKVSAVAQQISNYLANIGIGGNTGDGAVPRVEETTLKGSTTLPITTTETL